MMSELMFPGFSSTTGEEQRGQPRRASTAPHARWSATVHKLGQLVLFYFSDLRNLLRPCLAKVPALASMLRSECPLPQKLQLATKLQLASCS